MNYPLLVGLAIVILFPFLQRLVAFAVFAVRLILSDRIRPTSERSEQVDVLVFLGVLAGVSVTLLLLLVPQHPHLDAVTILTGNVDRSALPGLIEVLASPWALGATGAVFGVAAGAALYGTGMLLRAGWVSVEERWRRHTGDPGAPDAPEYSFTGQRAMRGLAQRNKVTLASLVILEEWIWRGFVGFGLADVLGWPVIAAACVSALTYGSLHVLWGAREVTIHSLNGLAYFGLFVVTGFGLVAPACAHAVLNAFTYRKIRERMPAGTVASATAENASAPLTRS